MPIKEKEKPTDVSLEEWVDSQTFATTADIEVPKKMSDRIIGQDEAVEIMKKAAAQKRHVMLIGEPGTGKSMLANSMVEFLPKEELQDIVAYHNPDDANEPRIRVFPAGKGKALVMEQRAQASAMKAQKSSMHLYICAAIILMGIVGTVLYGAYMLMIALFAVLVVITLMRNPMGQKVEVVIVPKVLVSHEASETPPFIDATGTHSGALLGDVRHDPYQSGGLETPSHDRLEAGDIHKANKGVLFLDEINLLRMESQQAILTAMQEKKMAITGQSERSSGALVKSEPVPCDFILVCAGNLDAMQGMHPALRSRIRGYGYEVYMNDTMVDTIENRNKIARFVAQEVVRDEKIPHFDKFAVGEIVREAQRRAGKKGRLSLRLRELGGLIRASGDIAVKRNGHVVTKEDIFEAKVSARGLEMQITDRQADNMAAYKLINTTGEAVGYVNGLAVFGSNSGLSEYSGIVMPLVAEVTPSQGKEGGRLIATGRLGEIAKEAVQNITAVIKKYAGKNLSDMDIHLQYVASYDGVDGDSASITMAAVILSAMEEIPIRQDIAMTGSLNVRGKVLPVGGITAKLEAAAKAGMKMALIPSDNANDVLVAKKYYSSMDIYTVTTFRDVVEYAFVDCPKKDEYMEKLKGLNPDGKSTARKLEAPKDYIVKEVRSEAVEASKPEPVTEAVVIEKRKIEPDAKRRIEPEI